MMTVTAPPQHLRSSATTVARHAEMTFCNGERALARTIIGRPVTEISFPDLSDPLVRALPISALALAWAVIELTGRHCPQKPSSAQVAGVPQ